MNRTCAAAHNAQDNGRRSRPVDPPVGPIAVLAGTYAEFREYARQNPEPKPVFCDRWPLFAGIEFSAMVEVGTFSARRDALDIYQRVAPMVRPNSQLSRVAAKERT